MVAVRSPRPGGMGCGPPTCGGGCGPIDRPGTAAEDETSAVRTEAVEMLVGTTSTARSAGDRAAEAMRAARTGAACLVTVGLGALGKMPIDIFPEATFWARRMSSRRPSKVTRLMRAIASSLGLNFPVILAEDMLGACFLKIFLTGDGESVGETLEARRLKAL